jgi:hypothetical protein
VLPLNAEYYKTFKSAPEDRTEKKAEKSKGTADNYPLESRIMIDAL